MLTSTAQAFRFPFKVHFSVLETAFAQRLQFILFALMIGKIIGDGGM